MALRIHPSQQATTPITPVSARPPNGGASRENPSHSPLREGAEELSSFETSLERLRAPRTPSTQATQHARGMAQVLDLALGESRAILQGIQSDPEAAAKVSPVRVPFAALASALADLVHQGSSDERGVVVVTEEMKTAARRVLAGTPERDSKGFVDDARRLARAVAGQEEVGEEEMDRVQGLRSRWSVELERLDVQLRRRNRVAPAAAPAPLRAKSLHLALQQVDAAAAIPEGWQSRLQENATAARKASTMIAIQEGEAVSTQANLAPHGVLHLLR